MREGVPLFASADADTAIGVITSGGFGPSLNRPVAMGYVPADMAAVDTQVFGEIRGKRLPLAVVKLPFIPANFKR
jgi:aminomethyltransferase